MDAKKEAKLNMYRVVLEHLANNPTITASVPAFQNAYTQFKTTVADITAHAQLEAQVITGIAIDKTQHKETLCRAAAECATLVYAYAVAQNNPTLKEAVNFSYSELYKIKDDELVPNCQNIYNAAQTHLLQLADYGITPTHLTNLQQHIDNYHLIVPKPRNAKNEKTTQKANITDLFKSADSILKDQLDKISIIFKANNTNFYTTYNNARVIYDPAKHPTQARIYVLDATTKKPISNATVTLTNLSTITATTNAAGEILLKPIPPAKYTITATATGYTTTTLEPTTIKLGQTTKIEILLIPA